MVQRIDQTPCGGQFALVSGMLAVDIAAGLLVAHRFDTQNDIEDRAEKHRHDVTVVILLYFCDLAAALHFDLAY